MPMTSADVADRLNVLFNLRNALSDAILQLTVRVKLHPEDDKAGLALLEAQTASSRVEKTISLLLSDSLTLGPPGDALVQQATALADAVGKLQLQDQMAQASLQLLTDIVDAIKQWTRDG